MMKFAVQRSIGAVCALAALSGCARGPDVSSNLPLRRVVIYRNGVGYFERAGSVDTDNVKFRMRQRMVGDFLATLAIVERGGSSVRAASFPIEVEDDDPNAPDPTFMRTLQAWDNPEQALKPATQNDMKDVVLRLDGEKHDIAVGYVSSTPVWRPSYRIVISDKGADLQAWGIIQNLSGEDWKDVELALVAGAPLAFESTLGNPVTPPRPVVTDSGEVIASVPEGLTSLKESDSGVVDRIGGAAPMPAPAAPPPPPQAEAAANEAMDEDAEEAQKKDAYTGGVGAGRAAGGAAPRRASKPMPKASAPGDAAAARAAVERELKNEARQRSISAPRNMSALAAVAVDSGSTRYEIPVRVTVPDESATMVLLISRRVPGEAVYLFAPDGGVPDSAAHPFRVARFTNDTAGLLERGPIAVFEKGAFLGQGMLDPLPPKATATVPFALERSLAVEMDRQITEVGARIFKIEAGQLMIERDSSMRTLYKIKNGSGKPAKLLVRHGRMQGSRLYKPPAGTEDNLGTGAALVPAQVKAQARAELTVDERQATQYAIDWLSPLADDAVRAYINDPRADKVVAQKLSAAWTIRESLKRATDERDKLVSEQQEIEKATRETRLSLEAIEKNRQAGDLRAKLTQRLGEFTARLEQITKRLIELKMSINEQEVRLRDAVRDIKLLTPLPPRD
jgi:hypothetical protein